MALWKQITHLVKDPPPDHIFELSEAGIAYARNGETGFQTFEPGVLAVSPVADNLLRPDAVAAALARIAPPNGAKRRPAAVILPDYAARVSLLDFDSFPSSPEEQLPLVRFRVKKTIPFDIDSAAVSYWAQPASTKTGAKKIEVVAVTVSLEILARYEAIFRAANLHPGEVTTSGLAALNLYHASRCGRDRQVDRQCPHGDGRRGRAIEIVPVPDDRRRAATRRSWRCSIRPSLTSKTNWARSPKNCCCADSPSRLEGLNLEMEPLRSRLGTPNAYNAGLLGYLEGAVLSMQVHINLASEPFRRDRPMLVASAACGVVLVALLGVLVFLIVSERGRQTRNPRGRGEAQFRAAHDLRGAGQARCHAAPAHERRSAGAEPVAQLADPAQVDQLDQAVRRYRRREADNVRLIQVRLPQINSRNEVTLDMEVGAKEPGPVIEFLKRLQDSPLFGPTNLSRSSPPTQNEPLWRYRVTVSYAQKL